MKKHLSILNCICHMNSHSAIFLQMNSVIIVPDGAVDNTVVCEETSRTVQSHIREVIYVQEEQDRSQNGALGDTKDYRFRVR